MSLVAELRRRHVTRVGLVYRAVALEVVQAAIVGRRRVGVPREPVE